MDDILIGSATRSVYRIREYSVDERTVSLGEVFTHIIYCSMACEVRDLREIEAYQDD
jgi:hypothetical protein